MKRAAFTMLELIFAIVIMAILAKFGVELLKQIFEGYARSLYMNDLQSKSANAVQSIANRLTYRIKDSIGSTKIGPQSIAWKGLDIDGWRTNQWSGIIDVDSGTSATTLNTPGTQATATGNEIFLIGSEVNGSAQYLSVVPGNNQLTPPGGTNFGGRRIYEFYQMTDGDHNLTLVGDTLLYDGIPIIDEVTDFMPEKAGDGIHIHLCVGKAGNPLLKGSVCKDKFIF